MNFMLWIEDRCVRHSRISGGVNALWRDYRRWLEGRELASCTLGQFCELLEQDGTSVMEVAGTVLVPGLGLEEDLRAALKF